MATQTTFEPNWQPFALNPKSAAHTSKEDPVEEISSIQTVRPDLRFNVFVSKEATAALAATILPEPWGPEHENLYKFIDYRWRAALFKEEVFQFKIKDKSCLVFHSGLQRRVDGEFIYFVLVPNDDPTKVQKWRIASSPAVDWSFKIAGDLLQFVDGNRARLPQNIKFYENPSEILLDSSAVINVDWLRIVETCRDRIVRSIIESLLRLDGSVGVRPLETARDLNMAAQRLRAKNYHVPEAGEIRTVFMSAFERTEKIARASPGFIVPQAFVDTNKQECRLEFLLPLFVEFDVRMGRGDKIELCFCVALQREQTYNGYRGMSVLTAEMAYTNARLVGIVNQSWLLAAAWPELYSAPLFADKQRKRPTVTQRSSPLIVPQIEQVKLQQSAPARFPRSRFVEMKDEDDVRSRSLFVRNIDASWSQEKIRRTFEDIGPICRMTKLANRDSRSNKQLCLVEMSSTSDAMTAIQRLDDPSNPDGIRVARARGRPGVSKDRTTLRRPPGLDTTSMSLPAARSSTVGIPQMMTVEVSNVGHHQTATTWLELLKFAGIDHDEIEWIAVYQPENFALTRFKTTDGAHRAKEMFDKKSRFGYESKIVRNRPPSGNRTFWKVEGGKKLSQELSRRLDMAKDGEAFYENPQDERTSRITRFSARLGERLSAETNTTVPLLRVQITTWRAPNRWRRSLPVDLKTDVPAGGLNPHAAEWTPTPKATQDENDDVEEDEVDPNAKFVLHDNHLEVSRGTPLWNKLQELLVPIQGLDVGTISEWPMRVSEPSDRELERLRLWFVGMPQHVEKLEKDGFLVKYGDAGRGRKKGFTMWVAPQEALGSVPDYGANGEVDLVLCDAFLTSAERDQVSTANRVRLTGGRSSERVETIVPKFVFHTSARRVGRPRT